MAIPHPGHPVKVDDGGSLSATLITVTIRHHMLSCMLRSCKPNRYTTHHIATPCTLLGPSSGTLCETSRVSDATCLTTSSRNQSQSCTGNPRMDSSYQGPRTQAQQLWLEDVDVGRVGAEAKMHKDPRTAKWPQPRPATQGLRRSGTNWAFEAVRWELGPRRLVDVPGRSNVRIPGQIPIGNVWIHQRIP